MLRDGLVAALLLLPGTRGLSLGPERGSTVRDRSRLRLAPAHGAVAGRMVPLHGPAGPKRSQGWLTRRKKVDAARYLPTGHGARDYPDPRAAGRSPLRFSDVGPGATSTRPRASGRPRSAASRRAAAATSVRAAARRGAPERSARSADIAVATPAALPCTERHCHRVESAFYRASPAARGRDARRVLEVRSRRCMLRDFIGADPDESVAR